MNRFEILQNKKYIDTVNKKEREWHFKTYALGHVLFRLQHPKQSLLFESLLHQTAFFLDNFASISRNFLVDFLVNLGAFLIDSLVFWLGVKCSQRAKQIGKESRCAFLSLGPANLRLVNVLFADRRFSAWWVENDCRFLLIESFFSKISLTKYQLTSLRLFLFSSFPSSSSSSSTSSPSSKSLLRCLPPPALPLQITQSHKMPEF